MKKIIAGLFVIALVIAGVLIFAQSEDNSSNADVAVSTYPLYVITKAMAGNSLDIELIGANADPHSFEPTAGDIKTIEDADLFITNGNGLDEWTEDVKTDTSTLVITEELDSNNLHLWLNPERAVEINNLVSTNLRNMFSNFNYNSQLEDELNILEKEYVSTLSQCTVESIIVPHNAYEELADEFGFSVYEISTEEESEPSGRDIAKAVEHIRNNNLKFLLLDPVEEINYIDNIRDEVDVELRDLLAFESAPENIDDTLIIEEYTEALRGNLETLKTALSCNQ